MKKKTLSEAWGQVFVNLGFIREDDGWVLQMHKGQRLAEELYLCVYPLVGMPSPFRHFDIQLEDMAGFPVNDPQHNVDIKELIDKILNWSCDVFIAKCDDIAVANTIEKATEALMDIVKVHQITLKYSEVVTHSEEHLNCVYKLVARTLAELEVDQWSEG